MSHLDYYPPDMWQNVGGLEPKSFVCGFCGNRVASHTGIETRAQPPARIYLCPLCNLPLIFLMRKSTSREEQIPSPLPGQPVHGVPSELRILYDEARRSSSAGAYTASVLVCRKMLVDLAVAQGDAYRKGKPFMDYVGYLTKELFAERRSQGWLDRIREQGNKATHELGAMSEEDSLQLITFVDMLFKLFYEFPEMMKDEQDDQLQDAVSQSKPVRGNGPDPKPSGMPF